MSKNGHKGGPDMALEPDVFLAALLPGLTMGWDWLGQPSSNGNPHQGRHMLCMALPPLPLLLLALQQGEERHMHRAQHPPLG